MWIWAKRGCGQRIRIWWNHQHWRREHNEQRFHEELHTEHRWCCSHHPVPRVGSCKLSCCFVLFVPLTNSCQQLVNFLFWISSLFIGKQGRRSPGRFPGQRKQVEVVEGMFCFILLSIIPFEALRRSREEILRLAASPFSQLPPQDWVEPQSSLLSHSASSGDRCPESSTCSDPRKGSGGKGELQSVQKSRRKESEERGNLHSSNWNKVKGSKSTERTRFRVAYPKPSSSPHCNISRKEVGCTIITRSRWLPSQLCIYIYYVLVNAGTCKICSSKIVIFLHRLEPPTPLDLPLVKSKAGKKPRPRMKKRPRNVTIWTFSGEKN